MLNIEEKRTLVLGIDPGFSGGLAILSKDNETHLLAPMPTFQRHVHSSTHSKRTKTEIDVKALVALIRPFAPFISLAVVEHVNARPGEGVSSVFRFGYGAGILKGVLTTLEVPTLKIHPSVWKTALNLDKDKQKSIAMANRLLVPKEGEPKRTLLKSEDGIAEAALLAHFAFTHFESLL